jgi:hypothetical protein
MTRTNINTDHWFDGEIVSESSWVNTNNVSLDIKQIFTSFCQQYFGDHSKFLWNEDLRSTAIVIADKNAIDLGIIERIPGILVSRGGMQWAFSPGQDPGLGSKSDGFGTEDGKQTIKGPLYNNAGSGKRYTDIVRGTVVFNCISKNGLQAEEIASELFMALTAYKTEIYKHGISRLEGLALGEEQILRSNSDVELTVVPVRLTFSSQRSIAPSETSYNLTVDLGDVRLYETIHYLVTPGTLRDYVSFKVAPESGVAISVSYYRLDVPATSVTDTFTGDGTTTEFLLSTKPYGYFKLFSEYIATLTFDTYVNTVGDNAEDYWGWVTVSGAFTEGEDSYVISGGS